MFFSRLTVRLSVAVQSIVWKDSSLCPIMCYVSR